MNKLDNLEFTRWASLGASFFLASCGGTGYAFGVYSQALQSSLGYNQKQIDLIGSIGQCGMYAGVIVGLYMAAVGPRRTLLTGAILVFVGFQYIYNAAINAISSTMISVSIMFFLAQLGSSCFRTTTVAVSIRNFPLRDRGKAAGLAKAYFGVSSAVLAELYYGFYEPDGIGFLRFLSYLIPGFALIAVLPHNLVPSERLEYSKSECSKDGEPPSFNPWFKQLAMLLSYLLMMGLISQFFPNLNTAHRLALAVGLMGLQASHLFLPLKYDWFLFGSTATADNRAAQRAASLPKKLMEQQPGYSAAPTSDALAESAAQKRHAKNADPDTSLAKLDSAEKAEKAEAGMGDEKEHEEGVNLNIWQALATCRFWALFLVFFCGSGAGLVVVNNIQQIANSMDTDASSFFVSLIGIFMCTGRALLGYTSDRIRHVVSRPQLLCIVMVVISLTNFVFATSSKSVLYPCLIVLSMTYGSVYALVAALCADFFGPRHIAANYGFMDLAPSAASFVFATYVVNLFFDEEECNKCFRQTFLLDGFVCLIAAIVGYFTLVDKKPVQAPKL
mmetsp:Transcript_21725/g.31521  ORF Transcript_21725/g.31521 Transcript_21725/m.31521 type:complete len:559 (-) Transcript_21725:350-2026(-)